MMARARFLAMALLLAAGSASQSGCFWITSQGPNLGPLAFPIPVPVGIQKAKEDQFWNYSGTSGPRSSARSRLAVPARPSTNRATTR